MKTVLKVSLKKNLHYKYSNIYDAQILDSGNMTESDIIDELLKEGIGVDKKTVLDIIALFNKKVAELVLSGNNVSTGLVNLSPVIKGSVNEKRWNPAVNGVEIALKSGSELTRELADTTLKVIDEKSDLIETFNLSDQPKQIKPRINIPESYSGKGKSDMKISDDPACGMAFRNWLWNS